MVNYKRKRWDAETSRINRFESNVISSHIELASEPQIVGDSPTKREWKTQNKSIANFEKFVVLSSGRSVAELINIVI